MTRRRYRQLSALYSRVTPSLNCFFTPVMPRYVSCLTTSGWQTGWREDGCWLEGSSAAQHGVALARHPLPACERSLLTMLE